MSAPRILVAEDEVVTARVLEANLARWGHKVVVVRDGRSALSALLENSDDAPSIAILDWQMPELTGVEVCRQVRTSPASRPRHLILLTGVDAGPDEIAAALDAGADEFLRKPIEACELRARVNVGVRVLQSQWEAIHQAADLRKALAQIRQLRGMLPMCSWCKRIRDDRDYWHQLEDYLSRHSDAQFTSGICPECFAKTILSKNSKDSDS